MTINQEVIFIQLLFFRSLWNLKLISRDQLEASKSSNLLFCCGGQTVRFSPDQEILNSSPGWCSAFIIDYFARENECTFFFKFFLLWSDLPFWLFSTYCSTCRSLGLGMIFFICSFLAARRMHPCTFSRQDSNKSKN